MKPNPYQAMKCLVVFTLLATSITTQAQKTEISISQQVPQVITAGETFDVTLTINKDNLESFARLQQTLPRGFSAKLKNGKDYHAFVKDGKAKLLWLSLPKDKQFTVTYQVKVNRRAEGDYVLGGEFNYMQNDKKQFAVVQPATIKVLPSALAALDEEEDEKSTPVGGSTAYEENIFDK